MTISYFIVYVLTQMTISKLQWIDKSDFSSLKEARAAQIDAEFDAMTQGKPETNQELSKLIKEKNQSEEELKANLKWQEAAEVAHTFLSMDDAGLKAFLENFRDKSRSETAGT